MLLMRQAEVEYVQLTGTDQPVESVPEPESESEDDETAPAPVPSTAGLEVAPVMDEEGEAEEAAAATTPVTVEHAIQGTPPLKQLQVARARLLGAAETARLALLGAVHRLKHDDADMHRCLLRAVCCHKFVLPEYRHFCNPASISATYRTSEYALSPEEVVTKAFLCTSFFAGSLYTQQAPEDHSRGNMFQPVPRGNGDLLIPEELWEVFSQVREVPGATFSTLHAAVSASLGVSGVNKKFLKFMSEFEIEVRRRMEKGENNDVIRKDILSRSLVGNQQEMEPELHPQSIPKAADGSPRDCFPVLKDRADPRGITPRLNNKSIGTMLKFSCRGWMRPHMLAESCTSDHGWYQHRRLHH